MRILLLVLLAAACQGKATPPSASSTGSGSALVAVRDAGGSADAGAAGLGSNAIAPGDIPLVPFKAQIEGVELVDAGAEPRSPLRYQYVPGTTRNTTFEVDFDRNGPTGKGPLPTLVMTVATTVKSVDPAGTGTLESKVIKVDERARPGAAVPPGEVAAQGALLEGAIITAIVTADGRTQNATIALPARDMTAELVDQAMQQLREYQEAAMPLPTEPIGAGGRWKYSKHLKALGPDVLTTTTVSLTSRDATHATFTSATTMTSPDRKLDSGSANLDVQISHFKGEGAGQGAFVFAEPGGSGESSLKVGFEVTVDGASSTIEMSAVTRIIAGSADQGEHKAP